MKSGYSRGVIAEIVVAGVALYAALGAVFAVAFVAFGIGRVDPAARTSGWGFRLLAIPGSAALWPLLAWRWARGQGPAAARGPHLAGYEP